MRFFGVFELADRSDDFRMVFLADDDDFGAVFFQPGNLPVYFGYQRTGSVKNRQAAAFGFFGNVPSDPVCRKHDRTPVGNLCQFVNEDGALGAKIFNHKLVVDNLVPHENRCPVLFQRLFNNTDRPPYAGAETARFGEIYVQSPFVHDLKA